MYINEDGSRLLFKMVVSGGFFHPFFLSWTHSLTTGTSCDTIPLSKLKQDALFKPPNFLLPLQFILQPTSTSAPVYIVSELNVIAVVIECSSVLHRGSLSAVSHLCAISYQGRLGKCALSSTEALGNVEPFHQMQLLHASTC